MGLPSIGNRLRACRRARGISADKAGVAIGVQSSTVIRYENGIITSPSTFKLIALSELYHVSPLWIFTGRGKPSEDEQEAALIEYFLEQLANTSPVCHSRSR